MRVGLYVLWGTPSPDPKRISNPPPLAALHPNQKLSGIHPQPPTSADPTTTPVPTPQTSSHPNQWEKRVCFVGNLEGKCQQDVEGGVYIDPYFPTFPHLPPLPSTPEVTPIMTSTIPYSIGDPDSFC